MPIGQDDTVRVLVGSIIMLAGSLWFLPALFPRLRSQLNNCIPCGATFAGFGMFMTGCGAAFFASGYPPMRPLTPVFILYGVSGAIVAAIGFERDKRRNPGAADRATKSNQTGQRIFPPRLAGLIIALALGDFLYLRAHEAWTSYWLLTDARQGIAVVTGDLWSGHGMVGYTYSVNKVTYTGKSGRNWQDPQYSNVQAGGQAPVFYSASHPWISLLYKPRALIEGAPVILVALVIWCFAIITIISPKSGWAFNTSGK